MTTPNGSKHNIMSPATLEKYYGEDFVMQECKTKILNKTQYLMRANPFRTTFEIDLGMPIPDVIKDQLRALLTADGWVGVAFETEVAGNTMLILIKNPHVLKAE